MENLGVVMVFNLVCGVQDLLQEVVERGKEEREREKQREEEEQRRLDEVGIQGYQQWYCTTILITDCLPQTLHMKL